MTNEQALPDVGRFKSYRRICEQPKIGAVVYTDYPNPLANFRRAKLLEITTRSDAGDRLLYRLSSHPNKLFDSMWVWTKEQPQLLRWANGLLAQRELTTPQFRFLRKLKPAWLVPFYMGQEKYSQHSRTRILLWVWRFGRRRWEAWTLHEGIRMDWIDDLRDKGGTRAEVYDRIKLSGDLTETTTDWRYAKGLV